MKYFVVFLLLFVSCRSSKTTISDTLTENAIVVDLIYNSQKHDSGISPGFTSSGDISFSSYSVNIPEEFGVVFRCDHGSTFPICGSDPAYKDLWSRMTVGDTVIVYYREIYTEEYEDNTLLNKALSDYDFLDARKQ